MAVALGLVQRTPYDHIGWRIGDLFLVQGLKKRKEYNFELAVIIDWKNLEKNRWPARMLDGSGKIILIKEDNMGKRREDRIVAVEPPYDASNIQWEMGDNWQSALMCIVCGSTEKIKKCRRCYRAAVSGKFNYMLEKIPIVGYCGRKCQKKHWYLHRQLCLRFIH